MMRELVWRWLYGVDLRKMLVLLGLLGLGPGFQFPLSGLPYAFIFFLLETRMMAHVSLPRSISKIHRDEI